MARRTRGNALLNAYMNRYMNDQASAVNTGEKNISNAATQGANQISAVPTDLPELTDFSDSIYSSILQRDKTRQNLIQKAAEAAQKAAEEQQKAAEAAAEAAEKAAAKTSRSSGGSSKKSSGSSSKSTSKTTSEEAELPAKASAQTQQKKTLNQPDTALQKNGVYALGIKKATLHTNEPQKKTFQEVEQELDEKQEAAKAAQKESTKYYAAGNNAATTQSTDVGLGSSYGAYAQSRASASAEKDRQALAQQKKEATASQQAEKKTTLANLKADPTYMQQLSQPGVKLNSNQIEAVKEYLKSSPDNKELTKQYEAGEISFEEYNRQGIARSRLEQKVSLGGLGQDLQAFTAGIYNSIPGLDTLDDVFTKWADKSSGGKYSKAVPQSTVETLQGYEQQNPIAGMAGQFAGNAALYGAANAALEGTAFANAAAKAGGKAASALKSIPGVGNLVTDGTSAAIGNIITGQTADLALDTIPSLASDVYSYANGNQDNLTPGQIAGNAAKNFGVNLAMNVGSEAIPALVRAGKNAVTKSAKNLDNSLTDAVKSDIPTAPSYDLNVGNSSYLLDAEDARQTYNSIPELDETSELYPKWVQSQTMARQASLGLDVAQTPDDIARASQDLKTYSDRLQNLYDQDVVLRRLEDTRKSLQEQPSIPEINTSYQKTMQEIPELESNVSSEVPALKTASPEIAKRAQELTGRGRQSQYTRQIENIFDRMANGETADTLAAEADKVARSVYRPSDFTQTVDVDPAIKDLRDYVKNTPIKISEKEAGDLLSSSGYKSVSAYNKANGTKFSMNNGVDWDTAMQELNGMNVGVTGNTFDDLLQAVDRSKAKAEKNFDEDLYSTYVDYVRDNILAGPDSAETFEDWLETQGFDYNNLPDYQQRAYDRWNEGTLELPQTAKDGLPEYGIGAKKSEFNRDIVPNRDYAGQAAARFGLDDAHVAQVGTSEHQVWTDAEATKQAVDDVGLYIQEASGDFDKAMDNAIADLSAKEVWDKGNTKTAQEVRDRLRTQFMQTPEGTPEFYKNAARYESFRNTISDRASKAGSGLQAFKENAITAETGIRKMKQVSDEIGQKWAEGNVKQSEKIHQLSEELDKLRKELNERNIADMEKEAMSGAFGESAPAGNMNKEFDAFLQEQGVKTDPTQEFNDLVSSVKELGKKYKVEISDETAKNIAGKIQAGESTESYYNKLLNEAAGITDLSLNEMEMIDDLYSQAAKLPDSKERYQLEQTALQIMASHLPAKSWFDRFDNIRYLAMLGNTRTHVRNVMGNVAMGAVTKAKDEVAATYQLLLPKDKRTKALYIPSDMKQAAKQYLNDQAYSTIRGGSKYNLAQGLEAARKTYGNSPVGKALQKLSDLNSKALEKEDEVFLQSAFVRSLASNLTAKGFNTSIFSDTDEVSKAVLKNAVNQAVIDAKDATFRSDGLLTSILETVGTIGKDNNAITQMAEKALAKQNRRLGGISKKISYMIFNGLLPFTKTPANILKTALEYTPVGGIVEAVYRGANKEGASSVLDALAKGTVGTGIIGLGWYLADAGLVQGSVDEETGKYDETLGTQNYSLVIPGKGSYTIDWASPSAVPFLIGANLSQEGLDLQEIQNDPQKYASQFADIMLKALDPVTEMSLLSSLDDTFNAIKYSDNSALLGIGKDLATSYVQQFIPTALGQVSRAIDPVRRSTYGGGDTQTERDNSYLLRSTLNKIPGLSEKAEPYIDQWGRTEASLDGTGNDAGGIAARLAYNMLSPGYYSAENVTPVDSYIQSLYDATGDSGVIPELAPNYINKGGNHYFTPEQKTTYATTSGQLSYSMLDELQSNPSFTGLSESDQADIVKDVYSLAKEVGASTAIPSLDYSDSKELKVYQSSGQTGAVNYFLAKNASDNARAEKQASTGNENADLTQSEQWEAISGLGLSDEDAVSIYLSTTNNEKANDVYSQYGNQAAADWLDYMYNYNYAYNQARAEAEKTGDKVSQQGIAESVLDQMGFDTETKRLFWQMTGSNWSEKNNPY